MHRLSSAVQTAPPLKILLVGQHALRAVLKRSQHVDLLQRINVHYQLRALTKEQTGRYIDIQMKQAQVDGQGFAKHIMLKQDGGK